MGNSIKKLTLTQYLAQNGIGMQCDFMLDKIKNPHGLTVNQRKKLERQNEKAINKHESMKQKLITEYNRLVDIGEVIPYTKIELMLITAHGHDDNKSTHASRRALLKRGINWRTGERI